MIKKKWVPFILPVLLIAAWQLLYLSSSVSKILLPDFQLVVAALLGLLLSAQFWTDVSVTVGRALGAFAAAGIFGTLVGILIGRYRIADTALTPTVDFLRAIPAIALFPLFIIAFGSGELARIAIPLYGAFWVMIVASSYGVKNAPKTRFQVTKILRMSDLDELRHVVIPGALPEILTAGRVALSLTFVLSLVAEIFINSGIGLGFRIERFSTNFETPEMYAVIFYSGVIGFLLNFIYVKIQNRILFWL